MDDQFIIIAICDLCGNDDGKITPAGVICEECLKELEELEK